MKLNLITPDAQSKQCMSTSLPGLLAIYYKIHLFQTGIGPGIQLRPSKIKQI